MKTFFIIIIIIIILLLFIIITTLPTPYTLSNDVSVWRHLILYDDDEDDEDDESINVMYDINNINS